MSQYVEPTQNGDCPKLYAYLVHISMKIAIVTGTVLTTYYTLR